MATTRFRLFFFVTFFLLRIRLSNQQVAQVLSGGLLCRLADHVCGVLKGSSARHRRIIILATLDELAEVIWQEPVLYLLNRVRAENRQLVQLALVQRPIDRVILRQLVVGAGMRRRARLRPPHLVEEVSVALAAKAVQVLPVAVVPLEDFNHVGGVVRVLRDQVEDLLNVSL